MAVVNEFRPLPPMIDDLEATSVKIEKSQIRRLGINEGDTVKVTGAASTGAVCHSVEDSFKMSSDPDISYSPEGKGILPQLRAGGPVLRNLNPYSSTAFIPVSVEKVFDGTRPASRVSLIPHGPGADAGTLDREWLHGLVARRGDRIQRLDPDAAARYMFLVTGVEPSDYAQITKDTEIEVVPFDRDATPPLGVFKPEGLQDVVPIVYEERIGDVTLTIPSLEVYGNGIKFNVHAKGAYGGSREFARSSPDLVVALHDDAGNRHALTELGGGGSNSPEGFEHDYEFLARPLPPGTRRLAITVREIVVMERFPRPGMRDKFRPRHMMKETREEYGKIDKFPSVLVISGPWNAIVRLNS